jgi:hypothetical protein
MKRVWALVVVLSFLVVLSGCWMAQNKPSGVVTETASITATVVKIDYNTRTVVLKGPKGGFVEMKVGEEARNFNQVKKGDIVTFIYSQTIAVDVRKARGDEPRQSESTSLIGRTPLGDKPGGTIRTTGYITAMVVGINYYSREIWLQMPDGNIMKLVAGPGVERFDQVNKGDEVVVQYTATVAITVQSP